MSLSKETYKFSEADFNLQCFYCEIVHYFDLCQKKVILVGRVFYLCFPEEPSHQLVFHVYWGEEKIL